MNSIWLVIVVVGILTFLTRFSFISVSRIWSPPPGFRRALQFVPVAVLAAIISSEIFMMNGKFVLSPINPRFIAGVVAFFIAFKTRNTIFTIIAGMTVCWIISSFSS